MMTNQVIANYPGYTPYSSPLTFTKEELKKQQDEYAALAETKQPGETWKRGTTQRIEALEKEVQELKTVVNQLMAQLTNALKASGRAVRNPSDPDVYWEEL